MTQPTQAQLQEAVQELTPGVSGSKISFDSTVTTSEQTIITEVLDAVLATPAGEYVAYVFCKSMPTGDTVLITNKILPGDSQYIPANNATNKPDPNGLSTTYQLNYDFSDDLSGDLLISTPSGNLSGTTTPHEDSTPTNESSDFFVADPVEVIAHEFAHLSTDDDEPLGSPGNDTVVQNFLQSVGITLPNDSNSTNVDLTNVIKDELRNEPGIASTLPSISPDRGNYEDTYNLEGAGSVSQLSLYSANPNSPDAIMLDNSATGAVTIKPSTLEPYSDFVTLDLGTYNNIQDSNGNIVISLSNTVNYEPTPVGTLTYSPVLGSVEYLSSSGYTSTFSAPTGFSLFDVEVKSVMSASGTPVLNFVQTILPTTSDGILSSIANTYDASGNLISETYNFSDGISDTLPTITSSGLAYNSTTGEFSFSLQDPDPVPLGTVSLDPATGASSLTLADGTVVNFQEASSFTLTDPYVSGMTPENVLLNYMGQLGDSLTATQFDQLNYNYLNPTGPTQSLTGTVQQIGDTATADVIFGSLTQAVSPVADITGLSTVTIQEDINGQNVPAQVTPTNILDVGNTTDLSPDVISNIQELDMSGDVAMTNNEFLGDFSTITGGGTIIASTAGTYNLNNADINSSSDFNLTADDFLGTTLIGDNQNNQTLTASLYGNDSLVAGNGSGDTLEAGTGIDTLVGGTGGDTFEDFVGLVSGTVVTGIGSGNALVASGDISGATITDVQKLVDSGPIVMLTGSEFNSFSTITGPNSTSSGGTLEFTTAGIFDLAQKAPGMQANMTALSDGGTNLDGSSVGGTTLTASATGNDTLVAYAGNNTLVAGGGNNLLITGTLGDDVVDAGTGVDTIFIDGGHDTIFAYDGLADGSYVYGDGGPLNNSTILYTGGDISGATLSEVNNIIVTSDSITMSATELANVIIGVSGQNGTTLFASTGGTYNLGGDDFNMVAQSSAATTFLENNATNVTLSANSLSGNDSFYTTGSTGVTLDASNTTGNDYLSTTGGSGNIIDGSNSTGNDTFYAHPDSNDTIYAGNGNDTIYGSSGGAVYAGSGNDLIYDGQGNNTIYTGTGADTIYGTGGSDSYNINNPLGAGSEIFESGGSSVFNINSSLANASIVGGYAGTDTFNISGTVGSGAKIYTDGASATFNIYGTIQAGSNIYGNSGVTTTVFNLDGTLASDAEISSASTNTIYNLNGTFQNASIIFGGTGTTTFNINALTTGGLYMYGGYGTNIYNITNGADANNTIILGYGTSILDCTSNANVNNGIVDLTNTYISDVQTLEASQVSLTATQFSGFSALSLNAGTVGTIYAATGGTYSLANMTVSGTFDLEATSSDGTTLIGNNAAQETLTASANGNDQLYAGSGTDTLIAGLGNDTFYGGSGDDTFEFNNASSTAQYTIVNSTVPGAQSTIDLGSSVTPSEVVATQSGNDLVLTIGADPITVQNYFTLPISQQSTIAFSNGATWTPETVEGIVSTTIATAQATITPSSTVNLGNSHVGGVLAGNLSITNSAPASTTTAESENLDAVASTTTGNVADSGQFTGLAAGSTDSTDIALQMNTSIAGAQTGTATINFTSDGTGIPYDYNLPSALPSQTLQVTGNVYRLATASVAALPTNLIVHVGDTVAQALTITNTDPNDGYSENLVAAIAGTTGGLTSTGTSGEITAGNSSSGITLGFSTATAGTISGTATVALTSDGTTIDGLGTTALSSQTVALNATVNNYAKATVEEISGGGTLTESGSNYTLTYNEMAGASPVTFDLGVLNNVTGPSDALSGSFTASAASGFTLSGLSNFSGLLAGQADTSPSVTFNGTTDGTYTETITLDPTGSNASGYSGALAPETLTINVNVTAPTGQTYTLTNKPVTINGGSGNNTIIATNGTLLPGDKINGGVGGINTLELKGGGLFDLTAPNSLTNVQVVTAQEGQLGYTNGKINVPNSLPVVLLRSGLNVTLNVASDTSLNPQDPNAAGILIYGNTNNSDIINLGYGNDQVFLGSNTETVNGGSGNSTYYVTSGTVGATIHGGSGSNTLVVLGGGNVVMGSSITGIKTVDLDLAFSNYNFTANNLANLSISDNQLGPDTITLENASQSYTGIFGAKHIDVSAAAASALIKAGTGPNSTLEITGGGNAILNEGDVGLKNIVLDSSTDVLLNNIAGLTVTGSSQADTLYAGTAGDTLTGNGGADLYFLNALGNDVIKDTAADLKGTSVQNFSKLDQIDIANLVDNSKTTLSYSQGATSGVLSITNGTTSTQITLLGQYSAAGFHLAKDNNGTGTDVTYSLAVTTIPTPTTLAHAV